MNSTIELSCPLYTYSPYAGIHPKTVTASFSGKRGDYFYANEGTAKNVELQLQTVSGIDLSDGKSHAIVIAGKRIDLPIMVRAYSGSGKAVDGTIRGTINVTYTYN
ncbi:hypothetical protein [Aeromonas hydrophila]|uniref:hypothetical protein n=1 Tax=Aeromonas hydrophila TaxID=644 RepID=UPI0038CFF64B